MKTQFAGANPFKPAAPKVAKVVRYVDPLTLVIANDPLPSGRANPDAKYDSVFTKMRTGQCLVCDGADAGKIGRALNVWLKKRSSPNTVKTTRNYETDGKGRVWLLAPEKKLKAA